jgi:hypothetical protein
MGVSFAVSHLRSYRTRPCLSCVPLPVPLPACASTKWNQTRVYAKDIMDCAHRPSSHQVRQVASKWGSHRPCSHPLAPDIRQQTVYGNYRDCAVFGLPAGLGIETFLLMGIEPSRQGSSRASSASVALPQVHEGETGAYRCLDGPCEGPPLVIRALRGPGRLLEWGSASSEGQTIGETLMASEFGRAVHCATHSANEGHRHHCRPQ